MANYVYAYNVTWTPISSVKRLVAIERLGPGVNTLLWAICKLNYMQLELIYT